MKVQGGSASSRVLFFGLQMATSLLCECMYLVSLSVSEFPFLIATSVRLDWAPPNCLSAAYSLCKNPIFKHIHLLSKPGVWTST